MIRNRPRARNDSLGAIANDSQLDQFWPKPLKRHAFCRGGPGFSPGSASRSRAACSLHQSKGLASGWAVSSLTWARREPSVPGLFVCLPERATLNRRAVAPSSDCHMAVINLSHPQCDWPGVIAGPFLVSPHAHHAEPSPVAPCGRLPARPLASQICHRVGTGSALRCCGGCMSRGPRFCATADFRALVRRTAGSRGNTPVFCRLRSLFSLLFLGVANLFCCFRSAASDLGGDHHKAGWNLHSGQHGRTDHGEPKARARGGCCPLRLGSGRDL